MPFEFATARTRTCALNSRRSCQGSDANHFIMRAPITQPLSAYFFCVSQELAAHTHTFTFTHFWALEEYNWKCNQMQCIASNRGRVITTTCASGRVIDVNPGTISFSYMTRGYNTCGPRFRNLRYTYRGLERNKRRRGGCVSISRAGLLHTHHQRISRTGALISSYHTPTNSSNNTTVNTTMKLIFALPFFLGFWASVVLALPLQATVRIHFNDDIRDLSDAVITDSIGRSKARRRGHSVAGCLS